MAGLLLSLRGPARRRYEISEEHWERLRPLLPGQDGDPGATAKDNRLFLNAVLWSGRTGAPWPDLPGRCGEYNAVWRRFDRGAQKGVWERAFRALQDHDLGWLLWDSTVARAHQHAAGAKKGVPT